MIRDSVLVSFIIHTSPISFTCAIALGRCSVSLSLSRLWVRGYVKESDLHRFNTNSIYFFRLNTTKKIEKRYIKYVSIIYNRIVMRKSMRNNRLAKIIKNVLVGQVLYTILLIFAHDFTPRPIFLHMILLLGGPNTDFWIWFYSSVQWFVHVILRCARTWYYNVHSTTFPSMQKHTTS